MPHCFDPFSDFRVDFDTFANRVVEAEEKTNVLFVFILFSFLLRIVLQFVVIDHLIEDSRVHESSADFEDRSIDVRNFRSSADFDQIDDHVLQFLVSNLRSTIRFRFDDLFPQDFSKVLLLIGFLLLIVRHESKETKTATKRFFFLFCQREKKICVEVELQGLIANLVEAFVHIDVDP